jgi:hypothetical protein
MQPDDSATGTPRWVKVFAGIALAVILLLVVALLTGRHGPDRHGLVEFGGPASAAGHT